MSKSLLRLTDLGSPHLKNNAEAPCRSRVVLPTELLDLVLSYFTLPPLLDTANPVFRPASKRALQNLRLTSRFFNILATPLLFHTIVLRVDLASANTLLALSSDKSGPLVTALPLVSQHIRCICINLDCYLKDVAASKVSFHNFQELVLDRMLAIDAKSCGLCISSYRRLFADVDATGDESVRTKFGRTLSRWNVILSLWDSYRPPLLPSRDRDQNIDRIYSGALDQGYIEYRQHFREQKRLLKKGANGIFLTRLQAALKKMPLLRNAILCDSHYLNNLPFNNPHRVLSDPHALLQFLGRSHSWEQCASPNASSTIGLGSFLIDLPIAVSRADLRLCSLELRTFLPPESLSLFKHRISTWKAIEAPCQPLKTFFIKTAEAPSVADAPRVDAARELFLQELPLTLLCRRRLALVYLVKKRATL